MFLVYMETSCCDQLIRITICKSLVRNTKQEIHTQKIYNTSHRRNQEIEMYTHTSGVDHEQGSLSLILGGGGGGVLPRQKNDFRDDWRTILSLFYGRKFVFFQEIFIRNVHVSFFTLRTCVVCVTGVTPLPLSKNPKMLCCPFTFVFFGGMLSSLLDVEIYFRYDFSENHVARKHHWCIKMKTERCRSTATIEQLTHSALTSIQ